MRTGLCRGNKITFGPFSISWSNYARPVNIAQHYKPEKTIPSANASFPQLLVRVSGDKKGRKIQCIQRSKCTRYFVRKHFFAGKIVNNSFIG